MRSISTVGVRSVRARRGRYVLTGMAIVLSVAVLFSVLVSAVSVNRGPDRFTADFTGRADVVATAMGTVDAAMAPDVVGLAQSLDGVDRAVGVAGFSAAVDVGEDDLELMAVQGVDIDEARAIRRFELADGRYFAPDVAEVVLPLSQARRLDVGLGGTVAVSTPGGRRELTVAGILADDGAGRFQAAVSPTCRCRWPSARAATATGSPASTSTWRRAPTSTAGWTSTATRWGRPSWSATARRWGSGSAPSSDSSPASPTGSAPPNSLIALCLLDRGSHCPLLPNRT